MMEIGGIEDREEEERGREGGDGRERGWRWEGEMANIGGIEDGEEGERGYEGERDDIGREMREREEGR